MEEKVTIEKTGWWKSFLKSEFFYHYKHNIPAIIGSILVVVAILVAVFGRFIAPQNPYDLTAISLADSYLPPVWLDGGKAGFLLGSDEQGRDILSAIIYGSASSIMIGLVGMICSCAIGTTLGLLAGYFGGKVDMVMQRITEILSSLPTLVVVTLMLVVMKPGLGSIIIALMLTGWINMSRIVRAQVLKLKDQEFVLAARTLGVSNRDILFKEILPNSLGQIIITFMFSIPNAIFLEAFLAFVGLGVPAPMASLGSLINDGYKSAMTYPHMVAAPVIVLGVLMLGFNLFADGLRDAIDPQLKQM